MPRIAPPQIKEFKDVQALKKRLLEFVVRKSGDDHATAVASVAAGCEGVDGFSPGGHVVVIGKNVGATGFSPKSKFMADAWGPAVVELASQGARVISISLAGLPDQAGVESSRALAHLMGQYPDILFVHAAGNDGALPGREALQDIGDGEVNSGRGRLSLRSLQPTSHNIVVVSGSTGTGELWPGSTTGGTHAALAEKVQVALSGGESELESGTSFATPRVANVAAKCLALAPHLRPEALSALLAITSDRHPSFSGKVASGGPISERRALNLAAVVGLLQRKKVVSPTDAADRVGLSASDAVRVGLDLDAFRRLAPRESSNRPRIGE